MYIYTKIKHPKPKIVHRLKKVRSQTIQRRHRKPPQVVRRHFAVARHAVNARQTAGLTGWTRGNGIRGAQKSRSRPPRAPRDY